MRQDLQLGLGHASCSCWGMPPGVPVVPSAEMPSTSEAFVSCRMEVIIEEMTQ